MPKLEGKRMIIYIAPKSVKKASKPAEHEEADAENVQKAEKKAPQQKAKKEFTLSVEGEDF